MSLVTLVIPSHLKPLLSDAIECVLAQTLPDWNLVIYDAGHWINDESSPMPEVFAKYADSDPRIEWVITHDALDFAAHYCPVSYRYNQAYREGRVTGKYSVVMPDDDLIAPTYLERLVEKLEQGYEAVYCSQESVKYVNGVTTPFGGLRADRVLTGDCVGRVDLLQVMWRTSVLERMTPPYFPEDPGHACRVQDGLFFNRLCSVTDGIHPIDEVLCTHRYHPQATYSPMS